MTRTVPRTAAGRALLADYISHDEGSMNQRILAIEAEAATLDVEQLAAALRALVEGVTALEKRAVRSSGEFHVWAEERMVTEARDEAANLLASLLEEPQPVAVACDVCHKAIMGSEIAAHLRWHGGA
jgi:hypothetical protein